MTLFFFKISQKRLQLEKTVFLETRKYDGVSLRKLNVSEIKQIAGRAGRRGIYNKGYVTAMTDRSLIKEALNSESSKIKKCYIGVPDSLLDLNKLLLFLPVLRPARSVQRRQCP